MERDIEIEATPEEVWEAIVDADAREDWLDDDREIHVETVEEQRRLVWWWFSDDAASRVEIELVPCVAGTRVLVRESVPQAFPLTALAGAFRVRV